ncbi:hypothetical protein ABT324_28210 [Saccharopolyspora sp. NPDC000359]|uniref:hypothetical protein n=1 Tax=Saccharopolyspora sp. NPDC000359 TaxID=3154251 RepID=UPI00331C4AC9
MNQQHWSNYLVAAFAPTAPTQVTITVDASNDHVGMVLLASRIRGLYDALKNSPESLENESDADLLHLANHLNRVKGVLTASEDDVLAELHNRGISSRRVANMLDTNHMYIQRRWSKIAEAHAQGLNTQGYEQQQAEAMRFEISHRTDDDRTVSVPANTKTAAHREAKTLQEQGIEATVRDIETGETEVYSPEQ